MTRYVPIAVVAVVAALLLPAQPALGGTVAVTLGLGSGGLSLQSPPVDAIAGRAVQVPLLVADARGTGAGWVLAVSAPAPVTVTSITARCTPGSTCTLPSPVDAAGPSIVLRAAARSGMGLVQLLVNVAPLAAGSQSVPLTFRLSAGSGAA